MWNKVIVVTTVHGLTDDLRRWQEMAEGWHIVVVGDTKTPPMPSSPMLTYLNLEGQEAMATPFVDLMPLNHYARKNIGYLWAIQQGACIIYETDDDNAPLDDWRVPPFAAQSQCRIQRRFLNYLGAFTSARIWPRGFPLDQLRNNADMSFAAGSFLPAVWQGLVSGEPDVDAIYRLVDGSPVTLKQRDPFAVPTGTYIPMNSQNTTWSRHAFMYMYLPKTISWRFADILRGYVGQRLLWQDNECVGVHGATVFQRRNEHDLMKDFADEITMYLGVSRVESVLSRLDAAGSQGERLVAAYASLAAAGVVEESELQAVEQWQAAVSLAGASREGFRDNVERRER